MWIRLFLLPGLLAVPSPSASAASGYIGAAACSSCHPAQGLRQASTGHAIALRRTADHPLAAAFFREHKRTRPPDFQFEFLAGPAVRISELSKAVDVPIDWAFGAGSQAVTFVSRVDAGHYVELFLSYYRALDKLGPTPGQQDLKPNGLAEAAGLYYRTRDPQTGIDGCFTCHSTGPIRFDAAQSIQPAEEGVRCEACHGPGERHVAAAKAGDTAVRRLIDNPARWTASEQLDFCGRCHRPPAATGQQIDLSYAWNVRHQPVYLARSACFRKSNGALSCITCHPPHEPLAKSSSQYNRQCSRCHQTQPAACGTNCVDCHMPRVSPQPPLTFTNHWIGIYDSGAKLAPKLRRQ